MKCQVLVSILQKLTWDEAADLLQDMKEFTRKNEEDYICFSYKLEMHIQIFPSEAYMEVTGPGVHEYIHYNED